MRLAALYGMAMSMALAFVPAVASADVESGPAVGEAVPALKVFGVVGDVEGKEVDYAAERGDQPTIYVFIDAVRFNRPTARFLRELDQKLGDADGQAKVVAVWMTTTAEETRAYLPKAQMSLQLGRTALAAFDGGPAGPEGWGINDRAEATVVVARSKKVAARFGFVSVNDTVVEAVLKSLKESAK